MVALIVISIGLLGIAKMQAFAVSSTTVSRQRGLAAIAAASLASSMHANRAFWAARTVNFIATTSGATVTSADAGLTTALATVGAAAPNYCVASRTTACVPAQLAANDLSGWAKDISTLLPNATSRVSCVASVPVYCTIVVRWMESAVGMNAQATDAAADAGFRVPDYTLYVEP
jgi:type IV pilus assembly protein PilV